MKKICRLGSLEISLVNMTKLEFCKKKVPFFLHLKNLDIHSSWKELLGYSKNILVTLLKVQFTMTIVINISKDLIISPAGKDKANQLQTKASDNLFYQSWSCKVT